MSKEEIKEGMENVAGGSGKEPKKYPKIIIRAPKYGGPRIDRPMLLYGGPGLRPIKPSKTDKPVIAPEQPVQPLVPPSPVEPENPENKEESK